MRTEILAVDPVAPAPEAIARAAMCLRAGGLVAFPTETVYGLGAAALDSTAVQRIFEAKGRPFSDPLIVHIASFDQLEPLAANVPVAARTLADRFWPGPLTLVVPRSAAVPDAVTAGLNTVAVRVPAHPVARALLAAAGVPIAAPSANIFSRPSPTRASHVWDDLEGRVDVILDAGPTDVGVESTVLDVTREPPIVLRPGAISLEALRALVPTVQLREQTHPSSDAVSMPSPGLLSRHYSPRAPLTLYEGDPQRALERLRQDAEVARAAGRKVGILDAGDDTNLDAVAARLYAQLRELDDEAVDLILARGCDSQAGLGLAIQDRLRRAAAGRIVRV